MASPYVWTNKPKGEWKNGACQCFHLWREVPTVSCLSSRCFKISKWDCFTYGLSLKLAFILGPMWVSLCVSPLLADFSFPVALWFSWKPDPSIFRARCFGGSSIQCSWQGLRCLMWDIDLFLFRNKLQIMRYLLTVGCQAWGVIYYGMASPHFLPILTWPFYPLLERHCSAPFLVLFKGNFSLGRWCFVVFVGGSEFRILLSSHLSICLLISM